MSNFDDTHCQEECHHLTDSDTYSKKIFILGKFTKSYTHSLSASKVTSKNVAERATCSLFPSRNRVNKVPHSFLPISYVLSLRGKDGIKLFCKEKKIAKLKEESIIADQAFKTVKSLAIKKLRLKTAESVAGLSKKRISRITGKKLCCKVHNARIRTKTVPFLSKQSIPVKTLRGSCRHAKVSN